MSEELKPVRCGCGGEAIAYIESMDGGFWHRINVSCSKCGIRTPKYDTESEAIKAWNRAMGIAEKSSTVERTVKVETYTDDQQETWSVCECGTDVWKSYNYCPECGAKLDWGKDE